ncbi:MAG: proton-conducting transporter membrane subunit [Gammaproteobacteria bacterium]
MLPELSDHAVAWLVPVVVALPVVAGAAILLPRLFGHAASETWTYTLVRAGVVGATLLALILAGALCGGLAAPHSIDAGRWFAVGHDVFEVRFGLDALGLAYGTFSLLMVALVAAFSRRYLHREQGFHRFYALLMLFAAGLALVCFAGSLDMLLIGWELVGISSTLLIAFFNQRPNPVRNALRAFVTYRACDVGLVLAIVCLHVARGDADFAQPAGGGWLALPFREGGGLGVIAAGALVFAAMGKSAQVPFSGWLPRAMEGPTPSSAIFYGALSVHLGPFLLLRCRELVHAEPWLASALVVIGLATAAHGALVSRVQTDIKSMLAYGSVTQVGLIMAEVGLGLYLLALLHIIGHAGYRTLQILRAPSLLHDRHHLEQMLGHHVSHAADLDSGGQRWLTRPAVYRHALERGGLDTLLADRLVGAVLDFVRRCDRCEQRHAGAFARALLRRLPPTRARARNTAEKVHVS